MVEVLASIGFNVQHTQLPTKMLRNDTPPRLVVFYRGHLNRSIWEANESRKDVMSPLRNWGGVFSNSVD